MDIKLYCVIEVPATGEFYDFEVEVESLEEIHGIASAMKGHIHSARVDGELLSVDMDNGVAYSEVDEELEYKF